MKPGGIIILGGLSSAENDILDSPLSDLELVISMLKEEGVAIISTHHHTRHAPFTVFTAAIDLAAKLADQGKVVAITRSWIDDIIKPVRVYAGQNWVMASRMLDRAALKHAAVYLFSPAALTEAEKLFPGFMRRPDVVTPGFGTPIDQIFAMLSLWRGLQYKPALDAVTRNVNGHSFPARVLFVGDQINPVFRHLEHWPFHDFGASALFMTRALHVNGIQEPDAVWANVNHTSSVERGHVKNLCLEKTSLRVVALGRNADIGLRAQGITSHCVLSHPSYARRFDHNGNYATQLKQAALD